ncbi:DNA phosphorothioation-dependent restriction protein DptH [Salinibius halmophilus]|uniref:DNA phosphorothioation-dependent restriction protein DptH n=1 Tax=Salinibius halmophilus TaxID=1853216 RepID=UPI000E6655A0|nr:DNA phosphorothioation-dependent restriction protein DptH [Salinibius halmophilus]
MSVKPFEEFVVDHFFAHANGVIKPGFKYQFKSPDITNSVKLQFAFIDRHTCFLDAKGKKLFCIEINGVKLLPVLHKDGGSSGYTENFISYLRDEVSAQSGEFSGTSLLIIHNSMLDTIINSAEDLTKPHSIFAPEKIKDSLAQFIDEKDSFEGQEVSKILLDYQYEMIMEDRSSMFGFETLHQAIADGDIRFHEIGLLEDPSILQMKDNPKQVKKRLDENKALYDEITSTLEHYPDNKADHLPDMGQKFVDKHFDGEDPEAWKQLTFDQITEEQDKNRQQNLTLVAESSASAQLFVRTKSEKKAAQKERHMLIVVDEDREDFDIDIEFTGDTIGKAEVDLWDKTTAIDPASIAPRGGAKETHITLLGKIASQPLFFQVRLKRAKSSEKFSFKCLVVKSCWFNTSAISNSLLVDPKKGRVVLQTQDSDLETGVGEALITGDTVSLATPNQVIDTSLVKSIDFEDLANEEDQVSFELHNEDKALPIFIEGAAATEDLALPLLLDTRRGKKLFKSGFNGTYNTSKERVYVDNKELKTSTEQKEFLKREQAWLDDFCIAKQYEFETKTDDIRGFAPDIAEAYDNWFSYLIDHNTLPSLAGWNDVYLALVQGITSSYQSYIDNIEENSYLDDRHKKIVELGIWRDSGEQWITPASPLVLNYYLHLVSEVKADADASFLTLPQVTLKRLNPQGLLPYLYDEHHEFSYVQAVDSNCFWLHCVPQQDTDYSYVTKLVKEKIREFSESFSVLFQDSAGEVKPTLTINSINNYDNHGLFIGIVEHLIRVKNRSVNIHVNIYDDEFNRTEFDKFADMASFETIKQTYGLNKGATKDHADTIADLMRNRISYSKFRHRDVVKHEYAHLSFFRNNEKVEVVDVNPAEKLSGISAGGLIAGEASASESGNYITGFGLAHVDTGDNPLLKFIATYSRLIKPARKAAFEYRENSAIALAVNERFKAQLEKSYDSSVWTAIIDPKVTLDFFETDTDALLIHYSDQYTSSAGYDAITVTKQTDLYDNVLAKEDGGLVSEFNAFNGEWLLKLITDNPKVRKERRGIIAAYKLVSVLLAKSDITWVPMSAAEIVRVSGNIGLKMDEQEFSRHLQGYKTGAISDDVLFVGFKGQQMYLLPLEVKTGVKYDATKAVKQAKELSRYLTEVLEGGGLASQLYRSLFVRQALMQIDKYKLYSVFPQDYFEGLLASKELWLRGAYKLAQLANYCQGFVVANLEDEKCFSTSSEVVDDILKIEVPASFIRTTISTPLTELWQDASATAAAKLGEGCYLLQSASVVNEQLAVAQPAVHEDLGQFETADSIEEPVKPELGEVEQKTSNEPLKVLVGHEVNHQEPVYWEPTNTAKFMNTNSGIIGTMGTGKTQSTKSVVTQLYRNQHQNVDGKPIGILIFDYKSDYVDDKFINATAGKKFNLHKLPYNPLSLFGDTPMLPVHTARGFSETMGKAFNLGTKQQLKLRKLIAEAYELAGIVKSDPSTWSKPAPTMADIWALFEESEPAEDSLYAALESLYELEIFEDDHQKCTSLYELVDGITVVELAGYPSEIQNLVVALTLDLFYSQMQKQGKPEVRGDLRQVTKLILVDEADNFMSQNFPSLRKILKEGREYGVGVILSTQDITHFKTGENDYSAYILSWVIHRVAQIKNQDIKALFNIDDKNEQERLMSEIRQLEKHYSLYVNGNKRIKKIKDKAFWELLNDA